MRLAICISWFLFSSTALAQAEYSCMERPEHRQFFEEQDVTGKWQVWFDGYYNRVD